MSERMSWNGWVCGLREGGREGVVSGMLCEGEEGEFKSSVQRI